AARPPPGAQLCGIRWSREARDHRPGHRGIVGSIGTARRRSTRCTDEDPRQRVVTRVDKDSVAALLKGRTVLVTGGDGFVGSHLVETLLAHDANVHVLVRPTSSGMLHNPGHVQKKATIHRADLTDKQAILQTLKILKSFGDQAVIFHLGAQAHVGECWNRPYETLSA